MSRRHWIGAALAVMLASLVAACTNGWTVSSTANAQQASSSSVFLDSDGDGLPDSWEISHGLSPVSGAGENGASGNPDGDGATNAEEFRRGTDPFVRDVMTGFRRGVCWSMLAVAIAVLVWGGRVAKTSRWRCN